jgi:hypothetical protein
MSALNWIIIFVVVIANIYRLPHQYVPRECVENKQCLYVDCPSPRHCWER